MRQLARAGSAIRRGLVGGLRRWYIHADADYRAFHDQPKSTGEFLSLDDHISRLKFFNAKAEKVQRLSFMQAVISQPPQVTATFLLEPLSAEIQTTTPHEESIDAFLYTFRFFMMGNEEISFRKMPELYEQLPISDEKSNGFVREGTSLIAFLTVKQAIELMKKH